MGAAEALSSWVFELDDLLFSDSDKAALDSWVTAVLVNEEAEVCVGMAEQFFIQQDIDKAIVSILSANIKNPNLAGVKGYFYAYMIHKVSSKIKNWYAVLRIRDFGIAVGEIKKKYKAMALMVHPDKCHSVAAEGATKLLNSAWVLLCDPARKKAYDEQLVMSQNVFSMRYQSVFSYDTPADSLHGFSLHGLKVFIHKHTLKRSREGYLSSSASSEQQQLKRRRVVIIRQSNSKTEFFCSVV